MNVTTQNTDLKYLPIGAERNSQLLGHYLKVPEESGLEATETYAGASEIYERLIILIQP